MHAPAASQDREMIADRFDIKSIMQDIVLLRIMLIELK